MKFYILIFFLGLSTTGCSTTSGMASHEDIQSIKSEIQQLRLRMDRDEKAIVGVNSKVDGLARFIGAPN